MSVCRGLLLLVAGAAAISSASCSMYVSHKEPPKKPVVPVSGQVLVDGKPAAGIMVTLQPTDPKYGLTKFPTGETNAEGKFKLGTYKKDDGAPAGDYIVLFVWPIPIEQQDTEDDKFMRLYSNPRKPAHKATVADKPLELPPYDLKLEGQKGIPLSKDDIKDLQHRKQMAASKAK